MVIFFINLFIILIFMIPACVFWWYIIQMQKKQMRSWADKAALIIMCAIFTIVIAMTLTSFCAIISGIDLFGAYALFV